jgi:uncharacterized protein YbjT (DUF2867 family)
MRHGRRETTGNRRPSSAGLERAMAHLDPLQDKLVVLIGGGGFLGSRVAEQLLARGARVRIAERHPEKAHHLRPLANVGQIQFMRCDVTNARSLAAALEGAQAAAYLVGTFGAGQQAVQAEGAGQAAAAAAAQGASAFVYVSAIGADAESDSGYAATKGEGEALVRAAFPQATVLRPAVLFGEDDRFVNLFAGLIAALPVLPVFGSQAKLQPLFVDDAAQAAVEALADPRRARPRARVHPRARRAERAVRRAAGDADEFGPVEAAAARERGFGEPAGAGGAGGGGAAAGAVPGPVDDAVSQAWAVWGGGGGLAAFGAGRA